MGKKKNKNESTLSNLKQKSGNDTHLLNYNIIL